MTNNEYLEESVACYKLGRAKSTLRKYAREGKIRYRKENNIHYFYNVEDIQKMLNQRLNKIIQNHSLTSDDITKVFLDTALLLMKEKQENIFIVFYPNDEKINYQIVFKDELKNIKQNYHVLDFNKYLNDGKHGNQNHYQIFATDTVEIIQRLHGVPSNKTPKDKIDYHLRLKHTLENFINLKDNRNLNASNIQQLFIWRKQLVTIFNDDSIEKQNIKVGFFIKKDNQNVIKMLNESTINQLKNLHFIEIPNFNGTINEISKRMNFNNNLFENTDKIKKVIDDYQKKNF